MYPNTVKQLIDCFKNLPGVGEKTAERFAFSMIGFDEDLLTNFSDVIANVRDLLSICNICGNICEGNICSICSDKARNNGTIFVVEKAKDIILFERLGVYSGTYHVLSGLISPLAGVGPDDINLQKLLERVKNDNVKEIILALKPSIEGETTMQYINRILSRMNVTVSKIATGVPLGTDMEYIDSLTLEMAIDQRKDIN